MNGEIQQTGALVNKTLSVDYSSYCLYASNERDKVTFLIGTYAHEFFVEYETEPDDNRWHHIAGTYDNRNMKLYYDGWLVGELDMRESVHYDECPLLIGSNYDEGYGDYQFHGLIDEVRISDYPREFHHGVERFPDDQLPQEFAILNIYPNPFNSSTRISYALNDIMNVEIAVFDLNGQLVEVLDQGERTAGTHNLVWNAENIASGVYFVRLSTPTVKQTQKVLLIR